jgi:flagellin
MISILNNISSLQAENALNSTQANLNKTLQQLSTGQRINSGADDPAGLAIANGLEANVTALTQSVQNASDGVGELQVADGALSQITTLLNQAVTIATEAATGTVSTAQQTSLDNEFTSIKAEITSIGSSTTYNGTQVFTGTALTVYMSDSSTSGAVNIAVTMASISATSLTLTDALTGGTAATALGQINTAISAVAAQRGTLGATSNQLQAASNVMNSQITNVQNAESGIMDADIGQTTANLSKYTILQQTGIAALQQSTQMSQSVLKLLQS